MCRKGREEYEYSIEESGEKEGERWRGTQRDV
jgi:hypothetical protein